jgi:hypothetical protein
MSLKLLKMMCELCTFDVSFCLFRYFIFLYHIISLCTSSSLMSPFWIGLTSFSISVEKRRKLNGCSTWTLENSIHCASDTATGDNPHWTRCCVRMVSADCENLPFHRYGATCKYYCLTTPCTSKPVERILQK